MDRLKGKKAIDLNPIFLIKSSSVFFVLTPIVYPSGLHLFVSIIVSVCTSNGLTHSKPICIPPFGNEL